MLNTTKILSRSLYPKAQHSTISRWPIAFFKLVLQTQRNYFRLEAKQKGLFHLFHFEAKQQITHTKMQERKQTRRNEAKQCEIKRKSESKRKKRNSFYPKYRRKLNVIVFWYFWASTLEVASFWKSISPWFLSHAMIHSTIYFSKKQINVHLNK
jgi:hypothetical protein